MNKAHTSQKLDASGANAKGVCSQNAYDYAAELATYAAAKFGPLPGWKPLPNLMGVLTQIDNMLAGMEPRDGAANARLIAAAPDLLEALQHAVSVIEAHVPPDALGTTHGAYGSWPTLEEYLHHMRAAIANATGDHGGEAVHPETVDFTPAIPPKNTPATPKGEGG